VTAVEDQRERGRELAVALAADGVAGLIVAWADNNGIPRSRTVPVAALGEVAATGVGAAASASFSDPRLRIMAEALGMTEEAKKLTSIVSDIYKADEYSSHLAESAKRAAAQG